MISAKQKKTLKKLLALGPQQDDTFTFDELMGYMFGIAITPSVILPSEWLPPIFAGQEPEYASLAQAQEMIDCLMQVYNTFNASFHTGQLSFPHDPMRNRAADLDPLIEWLFGFSEALTLRPDIWEPEDLSHLPEDQAAEIFSSLMTIQGLTNPQSFDEMVENLPEHFIHETLPKMSSEKYDRKTQIQALLLAMLPAAIETLVEYGKLIEEKRQKQPLRPTIPLPIRSAAKVGRNDPCPCNSGKKYKKCCGQSGQDRQPPLPAAASGRRATIIQGNFPRTRPQETKAAPIYQLKISLNGAKPPIWRRIQVPGSVTLFQLHTIIQHCMGWNDTHLHQFIIDKTIYSLPDEEDDWYSNKPLDERRFSLHTLGKQLEPFFRYIYDFGDDWDHRITVEKILPPGEGSPKAVLLTGKRACPPEDSGGIYGYMEQLEILATPDHEDHQEIMDWFEEDFQPAQFGKEEIQAINAILTKIT